MIKPYAHRKKLIMALVLLVALDFSSCKKYEDGPVISLKSKTKRLAQEWNLVSIDGGDFPIQDFFDEYSYFQDIEIQDFDIELEFEDDGDFSLRASYDVEITYSYYGSNYTYDYEFEISERGDWDFSGDKEEIDLDFDSNDYGDYFDAWDRRTFVIKKLTTKELILEAENGAEWTFEN
jgi:hypothetical protein